MPNTVDPALPRGRMTVQPELTAGAFRLRPWRPDDALTVIAAYADPAVRRWHSRTIDSPAEALEWIAAAAEDWQHERGAHWAVVDADDAVLGRMSVHSIEHDDALAATGYWTLPAARGRGVAVLGLDAATRWAFELGLHRIELDHSTRNPASCRVALKAGYRPESTRRSHSLHADGWHDMHLHVRIAGDPPASADG